MSRTPASTPSIADNAGDIRAHHLGPLLLQEHRGGAVDVLHLHPVVHEDQPVRDGVKGGRQFARRAGLLMHHIAHLLDRRADLHVLPLTQQPVPGHRLDAQFRIQLQRREVRALVLGGQQDLLNGPDGLEPEPRVTVDQQHAGQRQARNGHLGRLRRQRALHLSIERPRKLQRGASPVGDNQGKRKGRDLLLDVLRRPRDLIRPGRGQLKHGNARGVRVGQHPAVGQHDPAEFQLVLGAGLDEHPPKHRELIGGHQRLRRLGQHGPHRLEMLHAGLLAHVPLERDAVPDRREEAEHEDADHGEDEHGKPGVAAQKLSACGRQPSHYRPVRLHQALLILVRSPCAVRDTQASRMTRQRTRSHSFGRSGRDFRHSGTIHPPNVKGGLVERDVWTYNGLGTDCRIDMARCMVCNVLRAPRRVPCLRLRRHVRFDGQDMLTRA